MAAQTAARTLIMSGLIDSGLASPQSEALARSESVARGRVGYGETVASGCGDPECGVSERIVELWERTGDPSLAALAAGRVPLEVEASAPHASAARLQGPAQLDELPLLADCVDHERSDWLSTGLMACFKRTGDRQVFGLLHELSVGMLRIAVRAQIRRTRAAVDAEDVLQDVFLNIFRYPGRFAPTRADAFRNWAHRIARNTLFKLLKGEARRASQAPLDEFVDQREDPRVDSPLSSAAHAESAVLVDRAFLLWLNLYLVHFDRLSEREQRALTIVEVEGRPYASAAEELGIRLENLKMVVFRGRRKILRGMSRSLARLERELVRPRAVSHTLEQSA